MLKKILICHSILGNYSKKRYYLTILLNLLNSSFQLFGVGSLLFFVTLITSPDVLFNNTYYIKYFPFQYLSKEEQTFLFSACFLSFFLGSALLTHLSSIMQQIVIFKVVNNLRSKIFNYFFKVDLSKKNILDTGTVTNLFGYTLDNIKIFLESYLKLINDIFLSLFLITFLILLDHLSFLIIILFIILFSIMFSISKKKLIDIAKILQNINEKLSRFGWYVVHGHQEIVLFNRKDKFILDYENENNKTLKLNIRNYLITTLPKNIIEIIVLITIVSYLTLNKSSNVIEQLPFLTAILYCIYRLIPIFLTIYRSITNMKYHEYSFNVFLDFIKKNSTSSSDEIENNKLKKISFNKDIKISNVIFNYNLKSSSNQMKYNYLIKKGDYILVKGNSGIGKTTFFNILSGLIKPKKGTVSIDNSNIHENINAYWKILGYVPQNSYLMHGTLAWNITYKKNYTKKDIKLLKMIFEICELNKVTKNFKTLFENFIVTDAKHISGGQKQRIQIARILFKRPEIIIFDESFNAIDQSSELKILKSIKKYFKNITLILSSHRPNKIKRLFNKTIVIK